MRKTKCTSLIFIFCTQLFVPISLAKRPNAHFSLMNDVWIPIYLHKKGSPEIAWKKDHWKSGEAPWIIGQKHRGRYLEKKMLICLVGKSDGAKKIVYWDLFHRKCCMKKGVENWSWHCNEECHFSGFFELEKYYNFSSAWRILAFLVSNILKFHF